MVQRYYQLFSLLPTRPPLQGVEWPVFFFGIGAGVIGVLGKFYTSIPGFEVYGILAMNITIPLLEKLTSNKFTAPIHEINKKLN